MNNMLNPGKHTIELKDLRFEREKFKMSSIRDQNRTRNLKSQKTLGNLTHLQQKKENSENSFVPETDPLLRLTSMTKNLIDSGFFEPQYSTYRKDSNWNIKENLTNSNSSMFFQNGRKMIGAHSSNSRIQNIRRFKGNLSEHQKKFIDKLAGIKEEF